MDEAKKTELTNYLLATLKEGVEFGKQQAPEVAREIILYHQVSAIIAIIVSATILAIMLRLARWGRSRVLAADFGKRATDELVVPALGIAVASAVILCILLAVKTHGLIKATIAPRVLVLEYLTGK